MKKKTAILLASIAPMCLSLAGCNDKAGKVPQADIFYAYATENLLSDLDYRDPDPVLIDENGPYLNRDATLKFKCIKGENEGMQLIVKANKYISEFDFEIPDVTDGEKTISKDKFSASVAYYMDVEGSNEKDAYNGWYPDALIPLENYKWRRRNFIEKGRNQAIYINLKTENDTPAGNYKGVGKLTLDGKVYDIPFEVTVYDAVMPQVVHKDTSFLIWYEQIDLGEKKNIGPELQKKYFDFAISKRISPDSLPDSYESNATVFANTMYEYIANDPKVTGYRIPIYGGDISESKVTLWLQTLINKNIALRNEGDNTTDLFKKIYFYMDDEPSAAKYDEVRAHDKIIFDVKKALAPQLSSYPDLYKSFISIKNIVTTPYNDTLVATNETGGVQTWCPQFQNFQTKTQRNLYAQRKVSEDRDFGEDVWWYGCMDPKGVYPSYHLDTATLKARVIPYMQYDYNISGELYWNICYYSKYTKGFTTSIDIWNDPITWANCAGDGRLVYPGVDWGVFGPITTLRLENILAGSEEYEYLWMINEKVKQYNVEHETEFDTNELLQKYFNRLYTNMIIDIDNEKFEVVREELLVLLEAFNKNADEGMRILRKK